jgi:YbbR domain-containing protein
VRLPGFIRRNWRLKLLSTGVALVSWVGVVYAGNPPETKTVSVPVPQAASAIPAQFVLVTPVPNLQIRIGGNKDSINSFNTSALTVGVAWKSVTRAGLVNVPVSITNGDPNVQLIDPPKFVTADLDSLSSVTLPVNIVVASSPPPGYLVSSEAASPAAIVVAGAQHELPGLQARVKVDLSNRKTNVEADLPVLIYDAHDTQVTNLSSVDPSTVRVTVTVAASQTSRASAVVPNTVGTVAAGHELAGIRVNPVTVVLSGPQDLLNALDSVPTATISLNGLTGSVTVNVPVTPPAGVTAQPGTVAVTITVVTVPAATASPTPTPAPTPTPTPTPKPSPP